MRILQADPSLFTGAYDAALSRGLRGHGSSVRWLTRRLRAGEGDDLAGEDVAPIFYRWSDGPNRRRWPGNQLLKGIEHLAGLRRLCTIAQRGDYDVVHFQWALLPKFDRRAIGRLRRSCAVALTVHDLKPYNGKAVSSLQRDGFAALLGEVDHLFVHGERARATLVARGYRPERITAIAHGPLPLADSPAEPRARPDRWRIVLFGKLQDYKGIDVLLAALGELSSRDLARIEVVIAGEPLMPTRPLVAAVAEAGLADTVELRFGRLDDRAMAALLRSADAFVFPYRIIESSGVLHAVAGLGRWIVASDIGGFRDLLGPRPDAGQLVPVGDRIALARALAASIGRRPDAGAPIIPEWDAIGATTLEVYEGLRARRGRPQSAPAPVPVSVPGAAA